MPARILVLLALALLGGCRAPRALDAEAVLADCGFTIPQNAATYWVGEAMQGTDYKDKDPRPEATAEATATAARNAAHLAALLRSDGYPGSST